MHGLHCQCFELQILGETKAAKNYVFELSNLIPKDLIYTMYLTYLYIDICVIMSLTTPMTVVHRDVCGGFLCAGRFEDIPIYFRY